MSLPNILMMSADGVEETRKAMVLPRGMTEVQAMKAIQAMYPEFFL